MKRFTSLLVLAIISVASFSQNIGAFLSPVPGADIVEYIEVKYAQKTDTSALTEITFMNGTANERFNRDFKTAIELYNLLGRAGWSYMSEEKKVLKNATQFTVSFSRKVSMARMSNNMPQQRQLNNRPEAPTSTEQSEADKARKLEEKKKEKK